MCLAYTADLSVSFVPGNHNKRLEMIRYRLFYFLDVCEPQWCVTGALSEVPACCIQK